MEEVQKFEKQDYRFYVRVRTFLGETAKAIHQDLVAYGGSDFVAYSTIAKWRKDFSEGRMDIEDKPRSGRPRTQITEDNINLIERLIEADPHSTYADLALDSQLSHGTIERIIQDHLQKKKVAARWVPHKLTLDQKQKRVEFCQKNLEKLESEQWRKYDIVTCDETWIYLRHIGRKQEYEVWVNKGQSPNTVPRRGKFEEKRLYCFFFKASGWVAVHQLAKGQTLDRFYYIDNCLKLAVQELKKDRPKSGLKGLKLLHDNAKPHVNPEVLSYLKEEGLTVMPHPPYSPDLAPCDFWLIDYVKRHLSDQKDEESLFKSVTSVLDSIPKEEYRKTFDKLIERMHLCIENEGDYFEHLM